MSKQIIHLSPKNSQRIRTDKQISWTQQQSKCELDFPYAKSTRVEIPHTLIQSGVKFPIMSQRSKTIFVVKFPNKNLFIIRYQCCRSGSGNRDPVMFNPRIRDIDHFFLESGFRIPEPKPIFLRA